MSDAYEFRIAGRLSQDLLQTFGPSQTQQEAEDTVFVCPIRDDGELFGVIARCETLGLRLIALRRMGRGLHESAPAI